MNSNTKIMACLNQKGGVGKTTSVANIGYALANLGYKVLLIDFDSQASLTAYLNVFGTEDEDPKGIFELMVKNLNDPNYMSEEIEDATWEELVNQCICTPTFKGRIGKDKADVPFGVDLVPSCLLLSDYDLYVTKKHMDGYEIHRLNQVIGKITEYRDYDYILIDCSPYLGLLTLNAIVASKNGCLIPTNLDLMSTRGVTNLIDVIVDVQKSLMFKYDADGNIHETNRVHYGVLGVILNLFREGRSVDTSIQHELERYYPFRIFENTIPESINAKKAVLGGMIYSQVYGKAKDAYTKLAKEIIRQIKDEEKAFESDGDKAKLIRELKQNVRTVTLEEE